VIDRARAMRLGGEAGYSLVEMLTVMVIMGIVMAGITGVFVSGSKAQADQSRRFEAQVSTRLALDKIRRDIHCASDVSPITPYPRSSVTLVTPTGCGSAQTACSPAVVGSACVSWCTVPVVGYTNRYALYRQFGSTCSSAGGVKIADYLTNTSGNVFVSFVHTTGLCCLASLKVDFKVSVKGSTVDAYDLTDTIYLRNSTRI
jgi:prepilin-type N-terminal cleavage/methylation domain-containing protein